MNAICNREIEWSFTDSSPSPPSVQGLLSVHGLPILAPVLGLDFGVPPLVQLPSYHNDDGYPHHDGGDPPRGALVLGRHATLVDIALDGGSLEGFGGGRLRARSSGLRRVQ